ncbi:MAG: hypothetical protein ACR2MT_00155 [Aurantibacter sp.]
MKGLLRKISFSIFILFASTVSAWAQCAMCRASVENNISEGSAGLSAGLNTGILYLFVAPYLLVALIGLLWYWKSKGRDARSIEIKGHSGS